MPTDLSLVAFSRYAVSAYHGDRNPVFWVCLTLYTHHTIWTASLAREPFSRHGKKDQSSHRVAGSATSAPTQSPPRADLPTRLNPHCRYWWQGARRDTVKHEVDGPGMRFEFRGKSRWVCVRLRQDRMGWQPGECAALTSISQPSLLPSACFVYCTLHVFRKSWYTQTAGPW